MDIFASLLLGFFLGCVFITKCVDPEDEENKPTIVYLCDRKRCNDDQTCESIDCDHTMDIRHAKNFEMLRPNIYVEKEKLGSFERKRSNGNARRTKREKRKSESS